MKIRHAHYAPFVTLPTIIDKPGKYKTRGGETVTVEAVSIRHDYGCVGYYAEGIREGWHRSGRLYPHSLSANDIVEAV